MEISRELLFFFSALGAFNGLLMGLYFLFYARPKHISNYFLGLLLIMLSIRIGKSVFYYFNPELSEIFLQAGLTACFFIGPSLYFYLRSVNQPEKNHRKTWRYHLLVLIPAIAIAGYLYPWHQYPEIWAYYIFDAIYTEWLLYLIAAGISIRKVFLKLLTSYQQIDAIEFWMISVYLGNVTVWVVYRFVSYESYIVGALTFSFLLYLLVLLLVFNRKKDSILFRKPSRYADKKIAPDEATQLLQQLDLLMTEEKLFNDANLKISDVAKRLHILSHRLSQLINDNLGKSFPLFINEYRIKEAQKTIKTNKVLTLEAIGYECGFNSKSTFFTTFKKITGITPARYKETQEKEG